MPGAKFHITTTGQARPCKATKACPYGDLTTDHYDTKEEARAAYEKKASQEFSEVAPKLTKKIEKPIKVPRLTEEDNIARENSRRAVKNLIPEESPVLDAEVLRKLQNTMNGNDEEFDDEENQEPDEDLELDEEDTWDEDSVEIPKISSLDEEISDNDVLRDKAIDIGYEKYASNRQLADEICDALEEAGSRQEILRLIEKYGLDD